MKVRLSSLLVLIPLLAMVLALSAWVIALRKEVRLLDSRLARIEANQPLNLTMDVSDIGVPFDVDEAMQMDAARVSW